MQRSSLDLWVGFFVLAGLVALAFLSIKVANLGSAFANTSSYRVQATFDNIGGLKVRAPVKSAGVVVGRVETIGLDPKTFEALVTIHIDSRYDFPRDTFASVLTSGLLGEQYIGLDAGGDDSKTLKDVGRIAKTQSAVVLEKLISQFLFSKAADNSSDTKK
jgi:phospholipid/cholesterol/gamma-HCH transport system substrate-binding protein